MAKKTNTQLTDDNALRIPDNSTRQVSPADVRLQNLDQIDSFLNLRDGGLVVDKESGYSSEITITEPNAFITKKWVEENAPPPDLTDYYTKTEIDSFVVVQKEYTNPTLVSGGVTCLWVIPNELADKYAQVQIYDNSNYIITPSQRRVSETEIIFDFTSYTDIPANTYRCSVQGIQKTPPIPIEGFTYTFPFILS